MVKHIKANTRKIIKHKKMDLALITLTLIGTLFMVFGVKYLLSLFLNLSGYIDIHETPNFYLDDRPNTDWKIYLFSSCALIMLFIVIYPMIFSIKRWCYALINTSNVSYKNLFAFFKEEYLKSVLLII
ncbi:MAG: hypothetical protein RSB96_01825, partial [Oscillospiraceae bacterium]